MRFAVHNCTAECRIDCHIRHAALEQRPWLEVDTGRVALAPTLDSAIAVVVLERTCSLAGERERDDVLNPVDPQCEIITEIGTLEVLAAPVLMHVVPSPTLDEAILRQGARSIDVDDADALAIGEPRSPYGYGSL